MRVVGVMLTMCCMGLQDLTIWPQVVRVAVVVCRLWAVAYGVVLVFFCFFLFFFLFNVLYATIEYGM